MRIHAINAFEGDCLLLESDGPHPHFALLDGGPAGTFERHLGPYLRQQIGQRGTLDVAVVSHVDADHIAGVLDLLADIERGHADEEHDIITVADIWHNSFGDAIDNPEGSVQSNLQAMLSLAGRAQFAAANGAVAQLGISQGARLRRLATKLGIPLNGAFGGTVISQDEQTGRIWEFGAARFQIVGPTAVNLQALRAEWVQWIEDHIDAFAAGDIQAMANADKKIPNLSSIVLLGTTPHGDVLLTGDARGDHILDGLEQSGTLPEHGSRHFRLIKLQHHGSDRNVTREFFDRLTADIFLISANGKNGNPDSEVLEMLIDSAHGTDRQPAIVVTNGTSSIDELRRSRPADSFAYTLFERNRANHAVVIDLMSGTVN